MDESRDISKEAVLVQSESMPEGTPVVQGYDFNNGIDYHKLFQSYKYSGFQATSFGCAVEEINRMHVERCPYPKITQTWAKMNSPEQGKIAQYF